MKCIIIDKEVSTNIILRNLIGTYSDEIFVAGEVSSFKEAIPLFSEHHPDLLFINIELPYKELVDQLNIDGHSPHIIFTGVEEIALNSLEKNFLGYLKKPFQPNCLQLLIEKYKTKKIKATLHSIHKEIRSLRGPDRLQKIVLHSMEGSEIIEAQMVISCVADSNYTVFFLTNGSKIVTSKTLKEYEEALNPDMFFRLHNSTLVNMNHIKKYIRGDGGYVVMTDNSTYDVSRRKKLEFLEKLNNLY